MKVLLNKTIKHSLLAISATTFVGCVSWDDGGMQREVEPVAAPPAEERAAPEQPAALPADEAPMGISREPTPALPPEPAAKPVSGGVTELLVASEEARISGDSEVAAIYLERALRIAPENSTLWLKLAAARQAQGMNRVSETFALKAIGYSGNNRGVRAEAWDLIATAREVRGDNAGAAEAREASQLNR